MSGIYLNNDSLLFHATDGDVGATPGAVALTRGDFHDLVQIVGGSDLGNDRTDL